MSEKQGGTDQGNVVHLLIPTSVWDQSWIQTYPLIPLKGDTQSVKARKAVEDGR
jgi:hypothetical protein